MISIIFPNGKNLHKLVNKLSGEYEIFIAGKKDGRIKHENVKFVNEGNLAKSLLKCIEMSKGDYIILMNCEVKNAEKCIEKMVEKAKKGADIVVGRRNINIKSKLAKLGVNLLFPKSRLVADPLSEIFLIKRSVIKDIELHPIGSKFLLEILAKGKYAKIDEIDVDMKRRKFNESYSTYSKHLLKLAWKEGEVARWVKFGIVGLSTMFLNEFLLWLLLWKLPLIFAGAISIEVSTLTSFILNELWTFRDRRRGGIKEFFKRMGKYNFACLLGVMLNLFALIFLSKVFGIHPLKANIIGIAVAFIWNFLAHNLWTWHI